MEFGVATFKIYTVGEPVRRVELYCSSVCAARAFARSRCTAEGMIEYQWHGERGGSTGGAKGRYGDRTQFLPVFKHSTRVQMKTREPNMQNIPVRTPEGRAIRNALKAQVVSEA